MFDSNEIKWRVAWLEVYVVPVSQYHGPLDQGLILNASVFYNLVGMIIESMLVVNAFVGASIICELPSLKEMVATSWLPRAL